MSAIAIRDQTGCFKDEKLLWKDLPCLEQYILLRVFKAFSNTVLYIFIHWGSTEALPKNRQMSGKRGGLGVGMCFLEERKKLLASFIRPKVNDRIRIRFLVKRSDPDPSQNSARIKTTEFHCCLVHMVSIRCIASTHCVLNNERKK